MPCPECGVEANWDGPVCTVCGWYPGKKKTPSAPTPVLPSDGETTEPVATTAADGYTAEMAKPTGRDVVPGFAAMVKAARQQKDWSTRELAEACGLHSGTVSAIEGESRAPSLRVALAIVNALGIGDQFAKAYLSASAK